MKKYEEKIETLRNLLATGDDFSEMMDYFFTNLGENSGFLDLGKLTKNNFIKMQIRMIGQRFFKTDDITIEHLMLIKTKGTDLIHGGFFMNGMIGNLFYFEKLRMGLFALAGGGETSFFRLTSMGVGGEAIDGDKVPDQDGPVRMDDILIPPKSKAIH